MDNKGGVKWQDRIFASDLLLSSQLCKTQRMVIWVRLTKTEPKMQPQQDCRKQSSPQGTRLDLGNIATYFCNITALLFWGKHLIERNIVLLVVVQQRLWILMGCLQLFLHSCSPWSYLTWDSLCRVPQAAAVVHECVMSWKWRFDKEIWLWKKAHLICYHFCPNLSLRQSIEFSDSFYFGNVPFFGVRSQKTILSKCIVFYELLIKGGGLLGCVSHCSAIF